jgi:hypothetical protein
LSKAKDKYLRTVVGKRAITIRTEVHRGGTVEVYEKVKTRMVYSVGSDKEYVKVDGFYHRVSGGNTVVLTLRPVEPMRPEDLLASLRDANATVE